MPPKLPPRKPLMHERELAEIAEKPPGTSRAGVFSHFALSSSDDDEHDISPPASMKRKCPTQKPTGEAEPPTPVAPAWAHAKFQVPMMNGYAPGPSVDAPGVFNNGYLPSNLSAMPLGADVAAELYDQMLWNQALEYDECLAFEQVDMQASNIMDGDTNEIEQVFNESSLMSAPESHQVPADSHSPEDLLKRQTATDGYGSAYAQPYPTYIRLALGEDSAHTQSLSTRSYPSIGSAPPAMSQPRAWAWNTVSSDNVWEAPVSFAQQTPISTAMPVNNQVIDDDWRGYSGTSVPDLSNNHLHTPISSRHSRVVQQCPVNIGRRLSISLDHVRSCQRCCDILSASN